MDLVIKSILFYIYYNMVKLIDKCDWLLRLDNYPNVLGSNSHYTHNMNTLGNDPNSRYGKWFNIIGRVILNKFKNYKSKPVPPQFSIYLDKKYTNNSRAKTSLYIFFTTTLEEILSEKLGEPLYHDIFGEGFDDKKIKFSYASYFLESNGVQMHLGYDHRGSSIEVDNSKSPKEVTDSLIELFNFLY